MVAIVKSLKPEIVSRRHHTQGILKYTIDWQSQVRLTEYIKVGIHERLILNTSF